MDVAVIGAGPAGLMAAIAAAEHNASSVTVFEKNDVPGRKLLMTGGGRCNVTHVSAGQDWLDSYFDNGKFLYHAFSEMSPTMINSFFEKSGVSIISEKDGRCFPEKGKSKAILSALTQRCIQNGVRFEYGKKLTAIQLDLKEAVRALYFSDQEFICRACILAVGGLSYPSTGSSGDGYDIARDLGHQIIEPRPALAPVRTEIAGIQGLAGVSCKDVGISLMCDDKRIFQTKGDLLYTHEGLSGPGIMRLSRFLPSSKMIEEGKVKVVIDFFPPEKTDVLQAKISEVIRHSPKRQMDKVLREVLHFVPTTHILQQSGISPHLQAGMISKKQINILLFNIKSMPYHVVASSDFNQAMVTVGGVDLKYIHPKTMASRRVGGLYFAGEMMNIDGDTGGYNLQAAFSTGFIAGRAAALWIKGRRL